MKIFLDCSDPELLKPAVETGLIDGVTTNPTLMKKQGMEPLDVIQKISNGVQPVPQGDNYVSYCRKITKEDGRISFEKTAKEIFNKYRAFSGWPGTYFQYKDTSLN